MSTELVDPMASVQSYIAAERSSNMRRAYTADFADFSAWCGRVSKDSLPALPLVVNKKSGSEYDFLRSLKAAPAVAAPCAVASADGPADAAPHVGASPRSAWRSVQYP